MVIWYVKYKENHINKNLDNKFAPGSTEDIRAREAAANANGNQKENVSIELQNKETEPVKAKEEEVVS